MFLILISIFEWICFLTTSFCGSRLKTKFNTPIEIPVINAAKGLNIANKGPNKEYDARIESTPVVGVETKKLRVALLLAPSFCNDAATGITPQEQIGRGIPNSDAFIIVPKLFFPRCLVIKSVPIIAR